MNTDGEKPAPRANDIQHGGDHYRRVPGEQHWDRLVRLFGLPHARCYFVGNATAYAERYLEKGGVTDLHKAAHYLRKLAELEEDPTLEGSLAWLAARQTRLGAGDPNGEIAADEQLRRMIRE